MLTIGQRTYQLVRAHSQFHVTIGHGDLIDGNSQWDFEAHYVPSHDDPGEALVRDFEYLRICIDLMHFQTTDWRELASYSVSEDDPCDLHPCSATCDNLISFGRQDNARPILPGQFRVVRREGYLFSCEFDGAIDTGTTDDDGNKIVQNFKLLDEIPFATATVRVPINAADPVAAARVIVARDIGLSETARFHLVPFDPTRKRHFRILGTDKHHVTLETPWRDAK